MEKWIVQAAIQFLVRQFAKFSATIDWDKVKADFGPRIAAIVPGAWFDLEAVAVFEALVDAAAAVLSNTADIKRLLELCATEQWDAAFEALKDLILSGWTPTTAPGRKLVAHLKA